MSYYDEAGKKIAEDLELEAYSEYLEECEDEPMEFDEWYGVRYEQ